MKLLNFLNNNIIISIILSILIGFFLYIFYTNDVFLLWSFERHQNILSWIIRPLLLIPFCYFAYKKSINGILLIIFSIFTSMFWFPVPKIVDSRVIEFLNFEKVFLLSSFSIEKGLFFGIVILYFYFVSRAFWTRSIKLGLLVLFLGAMGKIIGSIVMSPEVGKIAIPFAVGGFLILFLLILLYKKINKLGIKK